MQTIPTIPCCQCPSREHSLFCSLPQDKLRYLDRYKTAKRFQKNEFIFREGESPHGLYFVLSGQVKIFKLSVHGKERVVRLVRDGDVLGYRAFFGGGNYAASAQTLGDTSVCFIERKGIERLCENDPQLLFAFLRKSCQDLREAEDKFGDLIEKSVEERMAHLLLLFLRGSEGKKVYLPLSREDMASLIGACPETVIRTLSDWKRKGVIDVRAKFVALKEPSFFEDLLFCE